jgi:orotate phosphoribosyltransferase (EC 2.4.2.10)
VLPHQEAFLALALEHEVLRFGEFTLKSGRQSPYFFNLGRISDGAGLARLARAYADGLDAAGVDFDLIFGPAYKGIPLAAALATEFAARGRNLPYAYDRKEAKDHGEGGQLVGAEVRGRRVLLVDDVLTAGTALRKSLGLLRQAGAEPVAALIALDRGERGSGDESAAAELARTERLRLLALVGVDEILEYLGEHGGEAAHHRAAIAAYQQRYGARA